MAEAESPPRLLRRPEVVARTGLSETRIDELEKKKKFPTRVEISARAIGWVESEINEFIHSKIAARDRKANSDQPSAA